MRPSQEHAQLPCFEIVTASRVFQLIAPNATEMDRWIACIEPYSKVLQENRLLQNAEEQIQKSEQTLSDNMCKQLEQELKQQAIRDNLQQQQHSTSSDSDLTMINTAELFELDAMTIEMNSVSIQQTPQASSSLFGFASTQFDDQ